MARSPSKHLAWEIDRRRFVVGAGSLAATAGVACSSRPNPPEAMGGAGGTSGGGGNGGGSGGGRGNGDGGSQDAATPDRTADRTQAAEAGGEAQDQARPADGPSSGFIDAHTHFWDPAKPGGIPWPPMTDMLLYKKFMPEDWEKEAKPRGITGTVLIEAVWNAEMNAWGLDLAERTPSIVAVMGRLSPSDAMFATQLETLARSRFFRGIRTSPGPGAMPGFVLMGDKGLTVDTGPRTLSALTAVADLAKTVPKLKIVISSLPPQNGMPPAADWAMGTNLCAQQPNVFFKVTGLVDTAGMAGMAPTTVDHYRPTLDHLWNAFGEDRLIFGSNWPVAVAYRYASFAALTGIVEQYFGAKGARAVDKFFAESSKTAYGWVAR